MFAKFDWMVDGGSVQAPAHKGKKLVEGSENGMSYTGGYDVGLCGRPIGDGH